MNYSVYQVDLPECPEAIIFVNGFVARDQAGFFWMWKKFLTPHNKSLHRSIESSSVGCWRRSASAELSVMQTKKG